MLLKPFVNIIKENKLKESKSYLGSVEDNNDPEKLGRVKIRMAIYDDLEVDDLPWVYPILSVFLGNSKNSIAFSVPEIGSQVRVMFPTGDKNAPYYTGAELNSSNKSTFFDEDYPHAYGFKDSKGNFVKINKATGKTTVQHSSTTNIEIIEDGSYTVTSPNGSTLSCDAQGNFEMNGTTLTINMSKNIIFNTSVAMLNATGFTKIDSPMVTVDGSFGATNGVTDTFPTSDGRAVTVSQGMVDNIE